MTKTSSSRIAVTMGDPAGIGPEIILRTVEVLAPRIADQEVSLSIVGSKACFLRTADALGIEVPWTNGEVAGVSLVESGVEERAIAFGETSADAGRLAYLAIEKAVALCIEDKADAIVTAPISKEALNLAGYAFSGHTELLAQLTGAKNTVMLLVHGNMRVSHISTHVALSEASKRLTPDRVRRVVTLTHEALRDLGIASPRIAVAALNPHAGENGMFGTEDQDTTAPTVEALRRDGIDVFGPIPGDTVFVKLRARQYDAVVATYHDQGHIPVKLLGFSVDAETGEWTALNGVNVTLGLPIVRTSVDHGTAFDIAGKGQARESSLLEAIQLGITLARSRKNR